MSAPMTSNRHDQEAAALGKAWNKLDELAATHRVEWRWVKGHAGDPGNERADELSNIGIPK